jgi:uncharacterized membrane protein
MSTTYFNNSNIKRLKNKKVSKKKDVTDINADNEKVVESFTPSSSTKEENPKSNIFSSSDSDKTTNTTSATGATGATGTTTATSATGKQDSNTTTAASSQFDSGSILVFCVHALLSVLFVYIWGALATNYLYLGSESQENLDYILPTDKYALPYSNNPSPLSKSWYRHGFPYDLANRDISNTGDKEPAESEEKIRVRQERTIFVLWLSKEGEATNGTNQYEANFFGALAQYLFQAVSNGLIKGGREIIRDLIEFIRVGTTEKRSDDTWEKLKDNVPKKLIAFALFPLIALQVLIPFIFITTIIATFIFGIIQEHIWWGIIFSFTIGMFIAMGCGVYMGLQTFYVFFLYPWVNNRPRNEGTRWGDIFNSLKTYMLIAFYILICFYSYEDLGPSGCGGIVLIVVASIIMQYMQNKGSK